MAQAILNSPRGPKPEAQFLARVSCLHLQPLAALPLAEAMHGDGDDVHGGFGWSAVSNPLRQVVSDAAAAEQHVVEVHEDAVSGIAGIAGGNRIFLFDCLRKQFRIWD